MVLLLLIVNVASREPSCLRIYIYIYINIVHAFLLVVRGSQAARSTKLLLLSSSPLFLLRQKGGENVVDEMPTIFI